MRRSMRTALAVLLVGALFASAGCAKAETPQTSQPTANVIKVKIGFAAPLTGDNAVYGEGMQRAVQMAIDEANAGAGKTAGFEFSIRAEDDQGDPKQAVNVANALVSDTDVVGIVGHFNSGCSIPAAPVYGKADLAMVTVSSNPALTAVGLNNVARVVAKDDAQGTYAGTLVYDTLGAKKVAVIDDSTPYGEGLSQEFVKAYKGKGGAVVFQDKIQAKTVDFSAVVTKIKSVAPAAVYYAGAHTEGALLSKQLKEAGVKIPLVGGDMLYTPDFIKIAGAANAEGDIATSLGVPLDQQPKGTEFLSAYKAKFGEEPQAYDSYAYDAANIIIQSVIDSKAERAAVMQAVRAGTFDGVTGSIAFDAYGDNKQQVISAYKVTGGEWKQLVK